MQPVIALLRHAEYHQPADVPSALLPYPLTREGTAQARHAAFELTQFIEAQSLSCITTIDSSTSLRAWQTATIIAEILNRRLNSEFDVIEYPALTERSVGAAANLTIHEIVDILATDPRYDVPPAGWKSDSDYRLPFEGAESLMEAGKRVADHIEWRYEQSAGKTLRIIVGHGGSIRHAAVHLGLLNKTEASLHSMYHATPLFVVCEARSWKLLTGNWKKRRKEDHGDEFNI